MEKLIRKNMDAVKEYLAKMKTEYMEYGNTIRANFDGSPFLFQVTDRMILIGMNLGKISETDWIETYYGLMTYHNYANLLLSEGRLEVDEETGTWFKIGVSTETGAKTLFSQIKRAMATSFSVRQAYLFALLKGGGNVADDDALSHLLEAFYEELHIASTLRNKKMSKRERKMVRKNREVVRKCLKKERYLDEGKTFVRQFEDCVSIISVAKNTVTIRTGLYQCVPTGDYLDVLEYINRMNLYLDDGHFDVNYDNMISFRIVSHVSPKNPLNCGRMREMLEKTRWVTECFMKGYYEILNGGIDAEWAFEYAVDGLLKVKEWRENEETLINLEKTFQKSA